MKTYLYDYTNFGILYVCEDTHMPINKTKWIFSILRSCILDTRSSRIAGNDPLYSKFNNQLITENLYLNNLTGGIQLGQEHETTLLFIEKRNRSQIIVPLIFELVEILYSRLLHGWLNEIGFEIHDTLAIEILNSDPSINYYESGILDYANTLNITPEQAYLEIKLECETYNSIKMRAYAVARKYQNLIRDVKTQEQADELMKEIKQKLIAETQI